jgi:hypothetical protein
MQQENPSPQSVDCSRNQSRYLQVLDKSVDVLVDKLGIRFTNNEEAMS